jgi:hypothetical protein
MQKRKKPQSKKNLFSFTAVWVYMCVCAWTVRRILFIFCSQEFIYLRPVPGEYKHSTSKKQGSFTKASKTQNGDFSPENVSNDFD